MRTKRLKKYFVVVGFNIVPRNKMYDDAFDVWAYNKIEAELAALSYYKNYNIDVKYIYAEVISCPFATIINRLRKKVPDTPTCEHI